MFALENEFDLIWSLKTVFQIWLDLNSSHDIAPKRDCTHFLKIGL